LPSRGSRAACGPCPLLSPAWDAKEHKPNSTASAGSLVRWSPHQDLSDPGYVIAFLPPSSSWGRINLISKLDGLDRFIARCQAPSQAFTAAACRAVSPLPPPALRAGSGGSSGNGDPGAARHAWPRPCHGVVLVHEDELSPTTLVCDEATRREEVGWFPMSTAALAALPPPPPRPALPSTALPHRHSPARDAKRSSASVLHLLFFSSPFLGPFPSAQRGLKIATAVALPVRYCTVAVAPPARGRPLAEPRHPPPGVRAPRHLPLTLPTLLEIIES